MANRIHQNRGCSTQFEACYTLSVRSSLTLNRSQIEPATFESCYRSIPTMKVESLLGLPYLLIIGYFCRVQIVSPHFKNRWQNSQLNLIPSAYLSFLYS